MSKNNRTEAEKILQQEDVQRALRQTTTDKTDTTPEPETKDKVWLGSYLLLLLGLGVLYYALSLKFFSFAASYVALIQRFIIGAVLVVLTLGVAKVIEVYLIGRADDSVTQYNLNRVLRLVVVLAIVFIVVSVIFVDWYAAIVSIGLISLVLGFALQTPISSFIGWIYVLVRSPYRVGDRIKIGDVTGDVIDVSYLDTTLWEFGGQYLSTDHPSGRIIKLPNSNVLSTPVFNYSWPLFPYIWNEIAFNVAYESDLEFVAKTMQQVVEEELGEAMIERVRTFRELLAQTPVGKLQVQERPEVIFRVSDNTWIEAIVRYLVYPREAGAVKSNLIVKLLAALTAEPDRVMFPKSDSR